MEYTNIRAVNLTEADTSDNAQTYKVNNYNNNLYWESSTPDTVNRISFETPFISDDWLITQSTLMSDGNNELYELDIVQLDGYYQPYFIILREGNTFVFFDGLDGILNDSDGQAWSNCKYVCPVWESANLSHFFNKSDILTYNF